MSQEKSLGIEQARAQLPSIVARAHAGKVTTVTRHGQPCAAIVPLDMVRTKPRRPGLLSLRGAGKGLWESPAAQAVEALRAEWD